MGETVMADFRKSHWFRFARQFLADRQGATAIEYALIAAGVGVTIASTVWGVGSALKTNWYDKLASMF
jgi:pilus assembly protein Flp/PilA